MGNIFALALPEGVCTTIKSVVKGICDSASQLHDHELFKLTIEKFYNLCMRFAKTVVLTGKADIDQIVEKSVVSGFFGMITCELTKKDFLNTCRWVCSGIYQIANSTGYRKQIYTALKEIANTLAESATTPFMRFFFKNVVDNATATSVSTKPALIKATGATIAEELVEGAGKLTKANASAVSTLKTGLFFDGLVWGYTVGYATWQYHKGNIDEQQLQRVAVTRTTATAGSIGMSSAGAFVGTLVFPGVGTFVGSVVGGVVGDLIGSGVGESIDNAIQKKDE